MATELHFENKDKKDRKKEKRSRQKDVRLVSSSTSFTISFIFVQILPNSMGTSAVSTLNNVNVKTFSLPSQQEVYSQLSGGPRGRQRCA